MIIAISLIVWILYALLEGQREAWYFHVKYKNLNSFVYARIPDEHATFNLQRSFMAIALIFADCYPVAELTYGLMLYVIITGLSFTAIFPFFHDGIYYYRRNKLDESQFPKKWADYSHTSSAKINLDFLDRVLFSIFSLLLVIVQYILYFCYLTK